ncbi:MAG: ABC transporter permease [Thermomicrobiales bacterium]|nr:ABC transporter permease [Thermomicrobiales bacterium]
MESTPGTAATTGGVEQATPRQRTVGVRSFFERLFKTRLSAAALTIIVLMILMAIFAPIIAPYRPDAVDFASVLQGPSREHLLGTDNLGRDVLSRTIYGSRVSLQVGIIAVGISLIIGTVLGLVAGYTSGSFLDSLIMRCMDALLAFPTLVLALAITAALGPSLTNVMIAVGVVGIPSYARLIRGQVLSVGQNEYVEAARTVGASDARIIWRHIMPNVTAPLIVQASIGVAFAILAEASLSFLGLGVQPPTPSWGGMLSIGKDYLQYAAWMALVPGAAIFLIVLAFNFLGDGIRDALDPHLRNR